MAENFDPTLAEEALGAMGIGANLMERQMLIGIKRRAEASRQPVVAVA